YLGSILPDSGALIAPAIEDVVQLPLKARQLVLAETEACKMGDVLYIGTGQVGHCGMIPDRTPPKRRGLGGPHLRLSAGMVRGPEPG
ncbi:MAG TPA: hypothetical protein VF371_07315, partial [Candidatus Limnocylindrales bacterium]